MINNTALTKWRRLSQKQLDQQFRQEIIQGLQCSPFEATAVMEAVYRVYGPYFETSGALGPGQLRFQVVAADEPPQARLNGCRQVTVTLTLDAGAEDLEVRRTGGSTALRRHRLQRLAHEAFQQGGLLTVEDLANRLLNCGERTLSRDLAHLHAAGMSLPLRSTVQDMGRSISHYALIISEWLKGKEYSEVAHGTHHSISSVQNYVGRFKRVIALTEEGYDVNATAFLAHVSPRLVETYHQLYRRATITSHRRKELQSFLKKGVPELRRGSAV
jgi:hypothetical protein